MYSYQCKICFGHDMESSLLVLHSEPIGNPDSGGKEVSVLIRDGIHFATFTNL